MLGHPFLQTRLGGGEGGGVGGGVSSPSEGEPSPGR